MRAIFLGAAALFFVSAVTPAAAVDLVPANPNHWAGFYAGVHLGAAKANRNGCGDIGVDFIGWTLIDPPDPIESCDETQWNIPEWALFDHDQTGHIAGFQLGYNWTPADNFLVGVELAASAAKITGEVDGVFGGVVTWNGLATATAKAGFTQDRFMLYGEAGFGVAKATFDGDLGCTFSMTHHGPVAGVGAGLKLTDTVSIDLKYQHIWLNAQQAGCVSDLFHETDPLQDLLTVPTEVRTQGGIDIVKLGLNFQLGNPPMPSP